MKLTALEANGKRCQEGFGPGPMSQNGVSSMSMAGAGYAYVVNMTPMNCIAGGCMAWQWTDERTIDGHLLGYCGKAGSSLPRPSNQSEAK
jgi:hypothetical protein